MSDFICHDFKTPRTDMSRRLPSSMRIVPLLFYVALGFSVFTGVTDYQSYKRAEREREESIARKDELNAAKEKLEAEKSQIEQERIRAEAIAKWIEGTRVIQPITVGIARAIPLETTISELSLERSPEIPSQVSLLVRMSNAGLSEITKIETALGRLHYRIHSPQQAKQGDQVEFKSMIVWQE